MRGTHDRNQPPHVLHEQEILNNHWPRDPAAFRTHDPGISVRVRVVWQRDGEEYLEGVARRWDAEHVYVELKETRIPVNGVWVKPHDVYRRSPG